MSPPPDSASDERPADAVGAEPNDPEERALADRLVNYADAVVALAVVGASGVGVAIADPDIRESFTSAAFFIAAGNVVAAALYSALIQLLRRWELDLRQGLPPAPKARRYAGRLHLARLALVWIAALQVIGMMWLIRP